MPHNGMNKYSSNMKKEIETILDEGRYNGLPTHIVAEQLLDLFSVVGRSEQLRSCRYVKRIGESCTLNNNCKYPNCE